MTFSLEENTGVPRVLCDTSVLIPPRSRKILVGAAANGFIRPYWSPWILAEFHRVLTWNWMKNEKGSESNCSIQSKKMMRIMLPYFRSVDPRPPYDDGQDVISDPDDLPVWAAAKKLRADYLISNNTKDFPPRDINDRYIYQGIEWITADNFFQQFELN